MKFAHPEILWALTALVIPILVHLFNFRRFKRVAFSNVAFLKEVQLETKSKNKLKHYLILLSRLLALAAIVLAFAQPYIPLEDGAEVATTRAVSIYIDNSFSMAAGGEEGRLLDLAKARASQVLEAYKESDRFQVLSNDLEGRQLRFYDRESAQELIDEIELSPVIRRVDELVERQQEALLEQDAERSAFLFSDLQKNTHRIDAFVPDSSISIRFVPEQAERAANIYIDSVWFDSPVRLLGQNEVLRLRVRNTGAGGQDNVPMAVRINGQQVAIGSFNVVPGTYTDTALYYTNDRPGFKHVEVEIQDHPVSYDDTWYLGYEVANGVRVLLVKGASEGRAFSSIFSNDAFYSLDAVDAGRVNYGALAEYDLVILDRLPEVPSGMTAELLRFMDIGGSVLFVPAAEGQREGWNELLIAGGAPPLGSVNDFPTKVASLNTAHYLYQSVFEKVPDRVDLPKVQRYYTLQGSSRSGEEVLMGLQNGDAFFFKSRRENGQLYAFTVPLDAAWSNLSQHALFVPTVLRVAEMSGNNTANQRFIGKSESIRLSAQAGNGDEQVVMESVSGQEQFIPAQRAVRGGKEILPGERAMESGNYTLQLGDSTLLALGMNYQREESVLEAWSVSDWQTQLESKSWLRASVLQADMETLSKAVEELDEGLQLWDRLLWLALILLLTEVLLIKFWKS